MSENISLYVIPKLLYCGKFCHHFLYNKMIYRIRKTEKITSGSIEFLKCGFKSYLKYFQLQKVTMENDHTHLKKIVKS